MLNIFQISFAYLGFDTVDDVNDTQFNCFKKQGFNLFIANLLDSATGEVDNSVVITMTSAISAGMKLALQSRPKKGAFCYFFMNFEPESFFSKNNTYRVFKKYQAFFEIFKLNISTSRKDFLTIFDHLGTIF